MSLPSSIIFMQGTGNRFAIVDQEDPGCIDPISLMGELRDRSMAVDGLLMLSGDEPGSDVRMSIINADGSSAGMCGNGLRCVAFELHRRGAIRGRTIQVAVGHQLLGARVIQSGGDQGMVWARMPAASVQWSDDHHVVDVGNRHGIIQFPKLPSAVEWEQEVQRRHQAGGVSLNWHAVEVHDRGMIRMKSWERGVGPTLACASGATATVAALAAAGVTSRTVQVEQPGGRLRVGWRGPDRELTNIGSVGVISTRTFESSRDALTEVM